MPVLSILAHGATAGFAPSIKKSQLVRRSETKGWTVDATRRNTRFLRTVDHDSLSGIGFACTLTVRDCPKSPEDWATMRNNFFKRLRRMKLKRLHWVTEWQRRGVPHLHVAVWFPEDIETNVDDPKNLIIQHWFDVSQSCFSLSSGQHVEPIFGFGGWAKYTSKHASRGMLHYQRCDEARPVEWDKSGRIWGKLGEWKTIDPKRVELTFEAYYRYRRLVRRWRIADAKSEPKRIVQARSMLKCSDKKRSSVRGVSEWIPDNVSEQMLVYLMRSCGGATVDGNVKTRITTRLSDTTSNQPNTRERVGVADSSEAETVASPRQLQSGMTLAG